jgi:galactokinase/mevalonate kinase-like predicted kinase
METAGRAGALGAKALGASGGGCVLVIARDGREAELARALAPLGERLEFDVDHDGFDVVAVMENRDADSLGEASR